MTTRRIAARKKSTEKPVFEKELATLRAENNRLKAAQTSNGETAERIKALEVQLEVKTQELLKLESTTADLIKSEVNKAQEAAAAAARKEALSEVNSLQEKIGVAEKQVENLANELIAAKKASVVAAIPEKLQITKVGKAVAEDKLIYISCKIRIDESAVKPVTLFGTVGAFNGLSQKAQNASEEDHE